ncbi:MAG: hypothetical protein HY683_05905 [Chloroflexi bacterium]|nr:hypothetical protein [Chloroflexota bacterium]
MTLVEQLVILGIVGVALATALVALAAASRALGTSGARGQAVALAVGQMEHVKGLALEPGAITYPLGVSPTEGLSVSTIAGPLAGADDNVQKVIVTVNQNGRALLVLEGLKVNRP